MSVTLYIRLHMTMEVGEYLGVFPDLDSAKQHASEVALERHNAALGAWERYGEDGIYAETQHDEWAASVYVIQLEAIVLNPSEYAAYDKAVVNA